MRPVLKLFDNSRVDRCPYYARWPGYESADTLAQRDLQYPEHFQFLLHKEWSVSEHCAQERKRTSESSPSRGGTEFVEDLLI